MRNVTSLRDFRKPRDRLALYWSSYGSYRREVRRWAKRGYKSRKPRFLPSEWSATVRTAKGREITFGAPKTLEPILAHEVEVTDEVLDRRRIARLAKAYESTTGPPKIKNATRGKRVAFSQPKGLISFLPDRPPKIGHRGISVKTVSVCRPARLQNFLSFHGSARRRAVSRLSFSRAGRAARRAPRPFRGKLPMLLPATPFECAVLYAERFGWHVFPCVWYGKNRKNPLIADQHGQATTDLGQIGEWWLIWPLALIGVSAGRKSGVGCLDIDLKKPRQNGWDTLERLGHLPLGDTPMQHTASGGTHALFAPGEQTIRSTTGMLGRTKGPDGKWQSGGLDTRGELGHFIAAAPGSGYVWDDHLNPDTVAFAPAPSWLNPPAPQFARPAKPVRPANGLSPYADAAIQSACEAIRNAGDGTQYPTLRGESYSIGRLAGAGAIPEKFARDALIDAGCGMTSYDASDRWRPKEIERVVNGCFTAGLANPRPITINDDRGSRWRRASSTWTAGR